MKRINNQLFSFLLLLFLLACRSKNEKAAEKNKLPAKDTSAFIGADNIPNPYSPVDISPMDISYYPVDYPILKMTGRIRISPEIRLIYSRPHLQGRALFHELLKYGQPWRLGANEATEIEFYHDVVIQHKKIAAGRYVLYTIPEESNWIIVLNTNIDTWGLKQDSTKDAGRFEIPESANGTSLEYFTMVFEKTATGANLVIAWADVVAKLPIEF